jgi:adenosine deaminase
MNASTRHILERMPKIELHVHLEGAVPRPALDELARKYGRPPITRLGQNESAPTRRRSFADFVDVWLKIGDLLREYEDYAYIARALAADFRRQNILYAEVLFSPARDSAAHLQPDRIAASVAAGFAAETGGPSVRLIADFVRDNGPAEAERAFDAILAMKDRSIVGIGIGGSEAPYPPEPFAPLFERARAAGFRTQAHAGESAGPQSIWGAIRTLHVERLAHGVRAREDTALLAHLKTSGLPLDICPTSNVLTGAVDDMADHPAADFLRRGLKISLSTDDPTLFGTNLAAEYETLVRTFGLEREDIRTLLRNAVDAAWCPLSEKDRLRRNIEEYICGLSAV